VEQENLDRTKNPKKMKSLITPRTFSEKSFHRNNIEPTMGSCGSKQFCLLQQPKYRSFNYMRSWTKD